MVIISSFIKALSQLADRRFMLVVLKGSALAFILLAALSAALLGLLDYVLPDRLTLPLIGDVTGINVVLGLGSFFVMLGLSVFLMVPVASVFTGIFLDEVCEAVEDKHYPHLKPAHKTKLGVLIADSLSFLGLMIVVNLGALIAALFFSVFAPFIFLAANGFLLGREYFQMVAMRRLGREKGKELYHRNLAVVWGAGILMAIPLTIPLINLFIPVLGAATFTHIFMKIERKREYDGVL